MFTKCPLCESGNIRDLYSVKGYSVVTCKDCSFVFVKDNISKDELANLYTETYFHNPAWYHLDKDKYFGYDDYIGNKSNIRDKFDRVIKIIKRYTDKGPLLDIGCGPGLFLELAKERGFTPVTGIDISSYAVDYCTDVLKLDVQKGDLLDFNLDRGIFNVITIFDVLEHFQNSKEKLYKVHNLLQHNGVLVIITPDIGTFLPKVLKNHWEELKHIPEHVVFFSKKTLTDLLQRIGFKIFETKYIGNKMSLKSFLYHTSVNLGINVDLNKIPFADINIPVNPFYKLLLIARKV